MPKLVISLPDAGEIIHELTASKVTVGRLEENDVQIDDASVSSHHAEITPAGEDFLLTDLGSTNGTRLNGEELDTQSHKLHAGDQIRFGKVDAIFQVGETSSPKPLPSEGAAPAVAAPAATSQRPQDFGNASPFQSKKAKKDPLATAAIAVAAIAGLAFAASLFFAFSIQAPPF